MSCYHPGMRIRGIDWPRSQLLLVLLLALPAIAVNAHGPTETRASVAISDDGSYVVSGSWERSGDVFVWETGRAAPQVYRVEGGVRSLDLLGDGPLLMVGSNINIEPTDGRLTLIDLVRGLVVAELETSAMYWAEFRPDATIQRPTVVLDHVDGTHIWLPPNEESTRTALRDPLPLDPNVRSVLFSHVSFSSDGLVAVASSEFTEVWSTQSGERLTQDGRIPDTKMVFLDETSVGAIRSNPRPDPNALPADYPNAIAGLVLQTRSDGGKVARYALADVMSPGDPELLRAHQYNTDERFRHRMDATPDGSRIAIAMDDGSVRVFDTRSGESVVYVQEFYEFLLAATDGDLELMREYASAGAVEATGEFGRTALHHAAIGGWAGVAEWLLESGADVNARDSHGRTPLIFASPSKPELMTLFLEAGANPDVRGDDGLSALDDAVRVQSPNRIQAMEILVANGATVTSSALQIAADSGRTEEAALLLSFAPDLPLFAAFMDSIRQDSRDVFDLLLEQGADPNAVDQFGNTPLSHASSHGREELLVRLLEAGAQPDRRGTRNPLDSALGSHRPSVRIVQLLLDAGADPDRRSRGYDLTPRQSIETRDFPAELEQAIRNHEP